MLQLLELSTNHLSDLTSKLLGVAGDLSFGCFGHRPITVKLLSSEVNGPNLTAIFQTEGYPLEAYQEMAARYDDLRGGMVAYSQPIKAGMIGIFHHGRYLDCLGGMRAAKKIIRSHPLFQKVKL